MSSHHNDDSAPAVSGFLAKTFDIFSDPANYDLCSWGPGGDTIIVKKIDDFSKIILPRHFKHSNFQSFVRQLNMYDFHKTVADPSNGQFQHVFFLQGRRDLLHLIKRKAHNHRSTASANTGDAAGEGSKKGGATSAAAAGAKAGNGAVAAGADGALTDAAQQKVLKTDLDRRIREIEKQQNRIRDLETSQIKIVRENVQLNQILNDTRAKQQIMNEKMEKILKLLYCMYTKTPLSRVLGPGDSSRFAGLADGTFSDMCKYLQLDHPFMKKNSLLEDSHDLGSPLTRGGSFDIAASSVVPPYGADIMSFPSFNGAAPSTDYGGDGMGKPLSRLHSLDPYTYPPAWTAAASTPDGSSSSSNGNSNGGLVNTFLNKLSTANAVPLLEDAPSSTRQSLTGVKRGADAASEEENKKLKTEAGSTLDGLPLLGPGTPLGEPLDKTNSSFFSSAVSSLLQNNSDLSLQRLDSLEATLSSLMDGEDALQKSDAAA